MLLWRAGIRLRAILSVLREAHQGAGVKAGPCRIEGCFGIGNRRGLCNLHRLRLKAHGDPLVVVNRSAGAGSVRTDGYLMHESGGRAVLEHVRLAERALGKPLPAGSEVHHVNGHRGDNRPQNLVICDSKAYHALLHRRQRALKACGHADWRRCLVCHKWDSMQNLRFYTGSGSARHPACPLGRKTA